jgi:hypothetical protein
VGVEYRQFYIARDPAWSGRAHVVVPRVHAMLRDWNLVASNLPCTTLHNYAVRDCRKLSRQLLSQKMRESIIWKYSPTSHMFKMPSSASWVHLNYGEETQGDRYLQKLQLVAGHDIRVNPGGYLFSVDVQGASHHNTFI